MQVANKTYFWSLATLYITAILAVGYLVPRSSFAITYTLFIVLFIFWFVFNKIEFSDQKLFYLGLVARLFLVFAMPALSDDFYRFLWDGKLLTLGYNPYILLPSNVHSIGLLQKFDVLFPKLNSPNYYTVYPTIVQIINGLSAYIGKSVYGSMLCMKLIFVGFELLSFRFLTILLDKKRKLVYWYWLCPSVIMEFVGNLHHEAIVIPFVLAMIIYCYQNKPFQTALFLSLAIFAKLTPIFFIPFVFFGLAPNQRLRFSLAFSGFCFLLLLPMAYQNGLFYFGQSLHLYFTSFEFNSSLYQLASILHWLWNDALVAYKILVLSVFIAYFLYWKNKKMTLVQGLIEVQLLYLVTAQSVHPWYLLPLLPLFALDKIPDYYLFWLIIIPLTYITYSKIPYLQHTWVNTIEYLGIIALIIYQARVQDLKQPYFWRI